MRPPKFAIEAGKLYYIINILMRPPKFAIEAGNTITSSIYLCDLLSLQ